VQVEHLNVKQLIILMNVFSIISALTLSLLTLTDKNIINALGIK